MELMMICFLYNFLQLSVFGAECFVLAPIYPVFHPSELEEKCSGGERGKRSGVGCMHKLFFHSLQIKAGINFFPYS